MAAFLRDAYQIVTDGKEPFFEYAQRFHQSDKTKAIFEGLVMKFCTQAGIQEVEDGNDPFEIKEDIFSGAVKFAREAFLIAVLLRTVKFASGSYDSGFNIPPFVAEVACYCRILLAV